MKDTLSAIEKAKRELEACDRLMEKLDAHMGILKYEADEEPDLKEETVREVFARLHEIRFRENRSRTKRAIDITSQLASILAEAAELFEEVEKCEG